MKRSRPRPANVAQFRRHTRPVSGSIFQSSAGFIALVVTCFVGVFTATFLWGGGPVTNAASFGGADGADDRLSANFGICGSGRRITCVVDGDTIWLSGTKIRVADINTPEISKPECANEKRLGDEATQRLVQLLNDGSFSMETVDRDEDKYGRKLRILTRGGQSLGGVLVQEGLAEEWNGTRIDWC